MRKILRDISIKREQIWHRKNTDLTLKWLEISLKISNLKIFGPEKFLEKNFEKIWTKLLH